MSSIVTRLTPAVPSAIATIAVYGPTACEIVRQLVKCSHSSLAKIEVGRVRFGLWNPLDGDDAAEQVVICRTQPQTVEIHCHGGNAVCEMILKDLVAGGCKRVAAADFPIHRDCEFEREAAFDLQRATTDRTAAILLDQLNGALAGQVARITECVRRQGAAAVRSEVESVLQWSDLGRHLAEPWQVVLAGPPNTGKSSLVNAIAGTQRVIVHAEPGTTRDWVEVLAAVDGWPVALSDTAGIRESTDAIEREGISRALQRVAAADLVVFVVDASVGWTETHNQLKVAANEKRTLTVWNKIDLSNEANVVPADAVCTSTFNEVGIGALLHAISKSLVPNVPAANTAVPFRQRHLDLLRSFC